MNVDALRAALRADNQPLQPTMGYHRVKVSLMCARGACWTDCLDAPELGALMALEREDLAEKVVGTTGYKLTERGVQRLSDHFGGKVWL